MQIESGSFENEALQKSTTFGLKFAVSRKLKSMENSDPLKSGKLRPRKLRLPKKSDQKTQTPTPTGKTKSTHLPCSFENLMGKGLNGMEKLFVS